MLISLYIIFAVLIIVLWVCIARYSKAIIDKITEKIEKKHNDIEEDSEMEVINKRKKATAKELDMLGLNYYESVSGTKFYITSRNKYNLWGVEIKKLEGVLGSTWVNKYHLGDFYHEDRNMSNLGLVADIIKLQDEGFSVSQDENSFIIENDKYKFIVIAPVHGIFFELSISLSYHKIKLTNVKEDIKRLVNMVESDYIDLYDWVEDNEEINGYELEYNNKKVIAYKSVHIIFNIDLENKEVVIKRNGYVLDTVTIENLKDVTDAITNRLTYLN